MRVVLPVLAALLLAAPALGDPFSQSYARYDGFDSSARVVRFSRDGKQLVAAGGLKNHVSVWDVASGRQVATFAENGFNSPLSYLDISRDSRLVASVGFRDPALTLSRLPGGESIRQIAAHPSGFSALAFSPTQDLLATAGSNEKQRCVVKLWDTASGKLLRVIYRSRSPIKVEYITGLAFSPDGRRLAASLANQRPGVKVFEVATGKPLLVLPSHTGDVNQLAYSPDGRLIAGAGGGRTTPVLLWDAIRGGAPKRVMRGHAGQVTTVAFSPEGSRLASAGRDFKSLFKLWDVATGRLIQSIDQTNAGVWSIAFDPAGQSLAVGLNIQGEALKAPTLVVFRTAKGWAAIPWHTTALAGIKASLDFPASPNAEINYNQTAHYGYSRYQYKASDGTYAVRLVQFKTRLDETKKWARVKRAGQRMVDRDVAKGAKLLRAREVQQAGTRSMEYILEEPRSGHRLRRLYRILFWGDCLVEMSYVGFSDSPSPARFLWSLRGS